VKTKTISFVDLARAEKVFYKIADADGVNVFSRLFGSVAEADAHREKHAAIFALVEREKLLTD
jgi:hypothetical protein